MAKSSDPDVRTPLFLADGPRQQSFDFIGKDEYAFEFVKETRQGFGLFRRKEGHGGYSYWSDEVPCGVLVYDEGLSNVMSIFEALEDLGQAEMWLNHLRESFINDKK